MKGAFMACALVARLGPLAVATAAAFHAGDRGHVGGGGLRARSALVVDVDRGNWSSAVGQTAALVDLAKPKAGVKIKRGLGWDKEKKGDDQLIDESLGCGKTTLATSESDKYARCPERCPLFVRDLSDGHHCAFMCVTPEACASSNPDTPVPDHDLGECRSPTVHWCKEYNFDGTDTCKTCKRFFHVGPDGQCWFNYIWSVYILGVIVLLAVLLLVFWWIDLECRPADNQPGLETGLRNRELQKIRMPDDPDTPGTQRLQWPYTTNLMKTAVAGPGMVLHFNFQAVLIGWALLVAACWYGFAYHYPELFILGTRKFGLARANCILVAWGAETQQRLMWTKIYFLVLVYCLTFLGCMWHGARQRRIFRTLDQDNVTMKDFVARCDGLPPLQGEDQWEMKLKDSIQASVGEDVQVIGTSICWDFRANVDEVLEQVRKDALEYDVQDDCPDFGTVSDHVERLRPTRRGYYQFEQFLFETMGPIKDKLRSARGTPRTPSPSRRSLKTATPEGTWSTGRKLDDEPPEMTPEMMTALLLAMKSSSSAFVVFRSEQERNMAVARLEASDGFVFEGSKVVLKSITVEPDTVAWWHFGAHVTTWSRTVQYVKGLGCILLGLLCWCVFFYGPYCYSALSFNYDNGQEPSALYGFAFSMVVVIGNAIMYEICARVSNSMGFLNNDSKEACYMILYTTACSLQVLLDIVVTWFIAWEISTGMHFRTIDGVRLEEIDDFTAQFESYAMQRRLAENAFDYAFPSTFLIPFVIEPFVTILVPLRLGILIVRSHMEIVGNAAEEWMASVPFDMGRYADLLLNVILSIIIFYFPGGYTLKLFLFMAASHVFIYSLDHARVLRVVPACKFATMEVDKCSQLLLIPCCALIMSCLVFKANCQGYGYCISGTRQVLICSTAFLAHCLVHWLCLVYIVPILGGDIEARSTDSIEYETMAKEEACSWFNANPVNCLRSKYVYKHDKPCQYWILGKEHTLVPNPEICCFFDDEQASCADLQSYKSGLYNTPKKSRSC
jgi:hypothetical protein